MQFYKEITEWLLALRKEGRDGAAVGKYAEDSEETENRLVFNMNRYSPANAEWIKAFQESEEVPSVISLRTDLKKADWNSEVLALCSRIFPNLRNLQLTVKAEKNFSLKLNFEKLKELEIDLVKKPSLADLSFEGSLPALEIFTFQNFGVILPDMNSLAELLSVSKNLKNINLYSKHAWKIAERISEKLSCDGRSDQPLLDLKNSVSDRHGWPIAERTEKGNTEDWDSLTRIWKTNIHIETDSVTAVCTDREKWITASEHLNKKADQLNLDGSVHSFILREPELLKDFSSVSSIRIFGAQELSQKNFQKLCDILPSLTSLVLINNHHPEFKSLSLRSDRLKELYLTHFHTLETFDIHSDSLEILELDNCSDSSTVEYPEKNMRWCNGFYGERFLSAFLNGNKSLHIPNLKSLCIWHNHNGFGPPLVYENRRMDIECTAGHSKLEVLVISRLSHIRNLTLKKLPRLRTLSVFDDFEENEGYMESLDVSDLPKDCEITAEGNSGISRKSEDVWSGNN